ncbi:MAG: hypothetical protein WBW03_00985 [Silvibacterium sp.]
MRNPVVRAIYGPINVSQLANIGRYALVIKLLAVLLIFACPFWLGILFFSSPKDYSYTSSLICVPLLAIVCAAAVGHVTQSDPYLRRLLLTGLVAHMAASSIFLWIAFYIFGGAADAFHYWTIGLRVADDFHVQGWSAFHAPYWSTNLINNICGLASLLIGDGLPTLFIAFALLSLWGGYFFYRAFTTAFPNGDPWLYGFLAVLSPSLLFWSSFVGKDSLIQLFIGLTCFGFAKLARSPSAAAVFVCGVGLAGVLLVRAHVAAILGIGMTFSYVIGKPRGKGGNRVAKIILIPVLLGGTYFLISQASSFLRVKGEGFGSTVAQANNVTKNSQIGGSAFNEGTSLPVRIAESPFLMFRPFPWELHNAMALAASVEALGWLLLCWMRRQEIWSALRDWRDPYVGFILMYSAVFSITFGGAISNFGILLRQRIMMVPVALMLLCARPKLPARGATRRLHKKQSVVLTALAQRSDRTPTGI